MKIFCIGKNYALHAKEMGGNVPEKPMIFSKFPTCLVKDNKPFYIPNFSSDVHHEVELVIKISKNGKSIQSQFAKDYYEEIALGVDFTCRDLQSELKKKGHPWEIAKAFDNSAPISEFLPIESLGNSKNIKFKLEKNGKPVQEGESKDLVFDFDYLVSYISQFFTLQKGDLIFTGTPEGVGAVNIGDNLKGYIEDKLMFDFEVK